MTQKKIESIVMYFFPYVVKGTFLSLYIVVILLLCSCITTTKYIYYKYIFYLGDILVYRNIIPFNARKYIEINPKKCVACFYLHFK